MAALVGFSQKWWHWLGLNRKMPVAQQRKGDFEANLPRRKQQRTHTLLQVRKSGDGQFAAFLVEGSLSPDPN